MKDLDFEDLTFRVSDDGRVYLLSGFGFPAYPPMGNLYHHIGEVGIAGENHATDGSFRLNRLSGFDAFRFRDMQVHGQSVTVIQESERLCLRTNYQAMPETNAIRVETEIENISAQAVDLTAVGSFNLFGFADGGSKNAHQLILHEYLSAQHGECQGRTRTLHELGILNDYSVYHQENIGSWPCRGHHPQGMIEDRTVGNCLFFQIESNGDWCYEIGVDHGLYYLSVFGGVERYHAWRKRLQPAQRYKPPAVAVAWGKTPNEALKEMTVYRRTRLPRQAAESTLPIIFNEYMHLRWDGPDETKTPETVRYAKQAGAECYVLDCGWHDEASPSEIYAFVGEWKESKCRFPSGLRKTTDLIRAEGMIPGLWMEPEVYGIRAEKKPPEEWLLRRGGYPVCELGRYLLDMRNAKVCQHLNAAVDRMINEYGAGYLKFDYNQDVGVGTDVDSDSVGDGLEQHLKAYVDWVQALRARYPEVMLEGCASGGQRMDPRTLSLVDLMSTSDQSDAEAYAAIAANLGACILPEQAGVWCYPASRAKNGRVETEDVILNVVNALLGRMQLASDLSLLTPAQMRLLQEGTALYRRLVPAKKKSVPYLPMGYALSGDSLMASGIRTEDRLYLAVWRFGGRRTVTIPLVGLQPITVKRIYPEKDCVAASISGDCLTVVFTGKRQARFFEIKLKGNPKHTSKKKEKMP